MQTVPAVGGLADEVDHMRAARALGAGCPQDVPADFDTMATGNAHLDVQPGQVAPTMTVHPRGRRAPRPAQPLAITPADRAAIRKLALTVGCPVPACRAAVGHQCRNAGPHARRLTAARTAQTAVSS